MTNKTLTIIKPFAVQNGFIGPIIAKFSEAGFKIMAMKYIQINKKQAGDFYSIHSDKSFFDDLTDYMSSNPIVVAILEKENAIEEYRDLIGATNPKLAEDGTIRKIFGNSIRANAVHGSDSDENADIESDFFFSKCERF